MKLNKQLNTFNVFSIGAGAMISSGIFILPALAYQTAGVGMLFSYLLAGILMIPAIFSQLELSTAIPKAGGSYFYVERILGTPVGTIAGVANWFSIALKSAFALVGIGAFATIVWPQLSPFQIKLIAATSALFFTLLNIFSVEASGKIQTVLVIFLIVILSLYIILGYRHVNFGHFDFSNLKWGDILAATGMVFISYGGITKIDSISEEVKDPGKTLVRGILSAFIVVQSLYLLILFVLIGVFDASKLAHSYAPISDSSVVFAGEIGLILTAIAAMLAYITTANAGLMTSSRVPLAMSRDSLLPSFFEKTVPKVKTPYISILLTSAFMILVIFAFDIKSLAKVASLFMILIFFLINLALIVIRFSHVANFRPAFRSPLFPFIQIVGIISYALLILEMGPLVIGIASGFIALSLIWYFVYVRKRVKRKSAFIHLVENLTSPDLIENTNELEEELLEILIERNEIKEDRFDQIIRQANILDLNHSIGRDELFHIVSQTIAEKWQISPDTVLEKLKTREEQTSTLIYPGIAVPHAIPHIVLEGTSKFDIVVVRNKSGIIWNETGERVYTVFCLMGTRDERNFHLRALMAIAQIIQNINFNIEWMKARDEKELRTVLLLSDRKRNF